MVAIAAANQFLAGGFYGVGFSVYFLPLTRDLGLSRTEISLAFSLRTLEGGFHAPLVGYLIDRLGPRFMMRVGCVLTGLGFILLAFCTDYLSFMVVFLGVLALGINAGVALPGATLVNHWFARKRALAITLSHIGAEIGGTLLTPLVALLVLNVGWRQAAIISGLAFLTVIPLLTMYVRNTPESIGLNPDGDPPRDAQPNPATARDRRNDTAEEFSVRAALKTSTFWRLAMAIGVRQFSKQTLMVHLIPLLVWKGFSEPTAALFLGVFAFSQIPFRVSAAHLADRWSMNKVSALSGVAGMCAVAVMLMEAPAWLGIGLLFAVLFALAETGNSSGWAVIGDFFGRNSYASIRGAISFVQSAISLPAPVLAGWVFDNTQSYQLALLPVAGCYLLTFILFWWMQRPQHQAVILSNAKDP